LVQDSIGPWLHRVACRIALRSKSGEERRVAAERAAARNGVAPPGIEALDRLDGALHEEIDRLPGCFRVPVVLCHLEGRSYAGAARHLGCPVGTVKSRLARGRGLLRARLSRRGLTPLAGAWGPCPLPGGLRTPVPAALSDSMIRLAMGIAAGRVVPASVALLT